MIELLHSPKIKPEKLTRRGSVELQLSTDRPVRQNQESRDLAERKRAAHNRAVGIFQRKEGE